MRLRDTVKRFATETFTDAFSTEFFSGHILSFSEVANSGVSAQRRILEVFPDTIIPSSRVVYDSTGKYYIVAAKNKDFWAGEEIRDKYPVIISSGTGSVGDIGEILAGTATADVHTFPYFARREIADRDLSDYLSGYELYFSNAFSFSRGDVLSFGGEYYRMVTSTAIDGAGFSAAQAIGIEDALQTLDVTPVQPEYDPITDTYPTDPPVQVNAFVELMSKDYEFVNLSFDRVEAGDKAISILKSESSVSVNDLVGDFRVVSVRDMGLFNTAHCRYLNP